MELMKTPRHDMKLEQAILGHYLNNPNEFVESGYALGKNIFYRNAHTAIFESIENAYSNNVSVTSYLTENDVFDDIGGNLYLMELRNMGSLCDAALTDAIDTLTEYADIRSLVNMTSEVLDRCYSTDTLEEIQNYITDFLDNSKSFQKRKQSDSINDIGAEVENEFFAMIGRGGKPKISSGLDGFDKITHGLNESKLYIVTARPKIGKTALMTNIAYNLAKSGYGTAIFNYETPSNEITQNLISRIEDINTSVYGYAPKLEDETDEEHISRLNTILSKIRHGRKVIDKLPIYFGDVESNFELVKQKCYDLKQEHPELKLIYIDGLQSFSVPKNYRDNKSYFFYDIANMAKQKIAEDLGVTVIINAQMTRDLEKVPDKRPTSSSQISDCKGLEEVADTIIGLYRPEHYWPDIPEYEGWMELIPLEKRVGKKSKFGPRVNVDMTICKIED